MQLLVQMQCLVTFTLGQLCDRNTRPAGNNTCDLFLADVLMYQRKIFILNFLFLNFQLLLQLWKFSILQFCRFFQIIILLCSLDLILDLLATTGGIIVYFLFLQVLRCFSSLR